MVQEASKRLLTEANGQVLAKTAADSRISERGGVDVWDDFSQHADGPLATGAKTVSGQSYFVNQTHGESVAVSGGGLVAVPNGAAVATYMQHLFPGGVRSELFEVSFTPYTTTGGTAAFGAWSQQMDDSTSTLPPDGPLHVGFSPTGWGFGYFSGGTLTNLATGTFSTPLVADSVTRYTAGVWIDPETSRAGFFVLDVDGTPLLSRDWTDSHFKTIPATYSFFEHFRAASTDTLPIFWRVSYNASNRQSVSTQRRIGKMPQRRIASRMVDDGSAYMAPTGSAANVDSATAYLDFIPETATALVTLSAYLRFHNFTDVSWRVGISTSDFGGGFVAQAETEGKATLASACAVGDTTLALTTKPNPGTFVLDPWSANPETVTIRATPTGSSSPYTATLVSPILVAHSSGVQLQKGSYECFAGRYVSQIRVTGLTAGVQVRFLWKHAASRSNSASLQRNNASGYPAIMSAQSI